MQVTRRADFLRGIPVIRRSKTTPFVVAAARHRTGPSARPAPGAPSQARTGPAQGPYRTTVKPRRTSRVGGAAPTSPSPHRRRHEVIH